LNGARAKFEPVIEGQLYCSDKCSARERMQRWRDRQKAKGPDGGGPPGPRRLPQLALFPRDAIAGRKPSKPSVAAAQNDLFQSAVASS